MSFHRRIDGEFRVAPMQVAHAVLGLGFVAVFLATGVYMRRTFPGAFEQDPGMRMMFRATHVYILFASLLNLLAAAVPPPPLAPSGSAARRRLAGAGSVMLLLAPPLLTLAFFVEPAPGRMSRLYTLSAVVLALLGVAGRAAAALVGEGPVEASRRNRG